MNISHLPELLRLWSYRYTYQDPKSGHVSLSFYEDGSVHLIDGYGDAVAGASSLETLVEMCPPCVHEKELLRPYLYDKTKNVCELCGALI